MGKTCHVFSALDEVSWTAQGVVGQVHSMLSLKISLKHVTVKSIWYSAGHFIRAREMSLTSSSQWSAALPQGISGAYPAIPPQVRPPGKSPTVGPLPQEYHSSICCKNLTKQKLMMFVPRGLCTFQMAGTVLCSCDVIARFPRAYCETCVGVF